MATEIKTYELPAWLANEKNVSNPVSGVIDQETEKAICLKLLGSNHRVWLPKSQITEPAEPEPKPKVAATTKTVNIAVRTNGKYCAEDCPMLEAVRKDGKYTFRYCKIFTEAEYQEDGLYQDDTGNWCRSGTCRKACGDRDVEYE